MREINKIIIHCSASPNGRHTTVNDIDAWHRARGFRRVNPLINPELTSIGYHFVIYTDGMIHTGRDVREVGAHAGGYNANSIGICMIGTDTFTGDQWDALQQLISTLKEKYPAAEIIGHRDLPGVKKLCPGFDVRTWLAETL
jgi:N-acetyl-anhydromuramyl-L-alanine amidase AmpD